MAVVKQEPTGESTTVSGDWSGGKGILPARETLGPLLLMATTPAFSIVFFHVCAEMEGNFLQFGKMCLSDGLFSTIYSIWPNPWDPTVWKMILSFMAFELFLQKCMPGKEFKATITAGGNIPIYKANGMASYVFTIITLLALNYTGAFRLALVYDKMGEILSSMNVFAFAFCTMLLVKGHVAPTNSDSGSNGNIVIDFCKLSNSIRDIQMNV
jgi:7-dehydrocholesterol reductase